MQFENHKNYNCKIMLEDGQEYHVYADWLHTSGLDHWQGWHCDAGTTRISIDKNLNVWNGMCRNDFLGSAQDFELLSGTICRRPRCIGCTDDLAVGKRAPANDHE